MATLIHKADGNLDVQKGGAGQSNWEYLSSCASMTGPSVSFGAIETRWCQDPNRAGKFRRSSRFRTNPDDITFDIMTKLSTAQLLKKLGCPFGLRARFLQCEGSRNDPAQYDPFMLGYAPVDITEKSYDDLVIFDGADNDEIIVTTPANAAYEYLIDKMTDPSRVGNAADLGDEEIVAGIYCSNADCGGVCGTRTDECTTSYWLTAGSGLYTNATLIIVTKDVLTGDLSFETKEITGGSTDTYRAIACAGTRIIIASQYAGEIGYSDDQGDTWSFVTMDNGATGEVATTPNFLYARTARDVWFVLGNGYVYHSTNGGLSWVDESNDGLIAETLTSVYAYDEDRIVVAGEDGTLFLSTNGGRTWDNLIDELNKAGIRVNHAVIPPERWNEIYVALNDGRIFHTYNEGATVAGWAEMTFSGSGIGSVDKLKFFGVYAGEQLWFMQTNATNQSRILRDLSGGYGGADVEQILGYTQVIAAGIELNDFDICETNYGLVAGAEETAYPVMIELL